jgi:hypothetical protein
MKYFLFGLILAAITLVIQILLNLTLLAAEHSNTVITIGFGVITVATSIFLCWYAVQGYRFVRSPLMVKHPQMFTK